MVGTSFQREFGGLLSSKVPDATQPAQAVNLGQVRGLLPFAVVTDAQWGTTDPTGVVDSTTAFQAALAGAVGVFVPAGVYKISATLYVKCRRRLIGVNSQSGGSDGVAVILRATAGFTGSYVVASDTYNSGSSDYHGFWHDGSIENIAVDCNSQSGVSGIGVYQGGEQSLLRRCRVLGSVASDYYLEGIQAVLTIEMCSSLSGLDYGAKVVSGSGSIRWLGFSGDNNRPGLVGLDGGRHSFFGLKYEKRNNAADYGPITVYGAATGGSRAQVAVWGAECNASSNGGVAGGALFTIIGTAKPSVTAYGVQASSLTNAVDDQVLTKQVAITGGQVDAFTWGQDGNAAAYHSLQAGHTFQGDVVIVGKTASGSSPPANLRIKNEASVNFCCDLIAQNGDPFLKFVVESGDNTLWSVRRFANYLTFKMGGQSLRPTYFGYEELLYPVSVPAGYGAVGTVQTPDTTNKWKFCVLTNGRKDGETAGNGSGVLAMSDGTNWVRTSDYTTVTI